MALREFKSILRLCGRELPTTHLILRDVARASIWERRRAPLEAMIHLGVCTSDLGEDVWGETAALLAHGAFAWLEHGVFGLAVGGGTGVA